MSEYPESDVRAVFGDCEANTRVAAGYERVMTLDTLVAGVHFPDRATAQDIAYKSVAVNFSDLAAMGAEPRWIYLTLSIPGWSTEWLDAFRTGLQELLVPYQVQLAAVVVHRGDLAVSIEAHGIVPAGQALLRSAAQLDDGVYVTGQLGDAGGGLQFPDRDAYLLQRLDRPTPRIETGICLRGLAHALIDISDGLLADLGHIASASHVSIQVEQRRLPLSENLLHCVGTELALELALTAGDDYELCFTMPIALEERLGRCLPQAAPPVTRIGTVVRGEGVQLLDEQGRPVTKTVRGFDHFAQPG